MLRHVASQDVSSFILLEVSLCLSKEYLASGNLRRMWFFFIQKTFSHFFCFFQSLIREDIKELVKWNIDRSTPSAKLRDLLMWSQDIIKDVQYQKKVLKNPFLKFLAMRWWVNFRYFTSIFYFPFWNLCLQVKRNTIFLTKSYFWPLYYFNPGWSGILPVFWWASP